MSQVTFHKIIHQMNKPRGRKVPWLGGQPSSKFCRRSGKVRKRSTVSTEGGRASKGAEGRIVEQSEWGYDVVHPRTSTLMVDELGRSALAPASSALPARAEHFSASLFGLFKMHV